MNHWDEQIILLSSTKKNWKCTRAAKRSLMKILSAWWNFRSCKGWILFLSVDRLKTIFSSHLWKICFFLNYPPRMNRWDEHSILLFSSKTESICTRAEKRSLMKILSAWWNFRSDKCWNLFLSADKLKTLFSSHLWKICFFLKYTPRMTRWNEQIILHSSTKTESNRTRAAKRSLMKTMSAWWNFRNCECWNLFLSVDMLKPFFWSHLWRNCFFSKSTPWMTRWDEQNILLSSTKTEWKCTRAERRSLMKILSAWWNFRSSKFWKLFLSVDRLKPLFSSHLWKNCFFLKYPQRMNQWDDSMSCSFRVKRKRIAPGPRKEVWWRYWVHGETSEVVNVGTCF